MQFSITNSSIFPHSSSSSSQLYGFGFNEAVSDNPLQIDSHLNANGSSFYMDMAVPHHIQSSFTGGAYTQFPFANCNSGTLSAVTIQSMDLPSYESSNFTNKKHNQCHTERLPEQTSHELGSVVTRKRQIEKVGERSAKRSPAFSGGNGPSLSGQWTTAKKMATQVQKKMQRLNHSAQKDRVVPPRKSQKLAEKITALQKLVSPYGKTDTASVLHEASIFINVLLDQIESCVHSTEDGQPQSVSNSKMMDCDLRGKGLCLVPVSLTKNLIPSDSFTHFSTTDAMLPQDAISYGRTLKFLNSK